MEAESISNEKYLTVKGIISKEDGVTEILKECDVIEESDDTNIQHVVQDQNQEQK